MALRPQLSNYRKAMLALLCYELSLTAGHWAYLVLMDLGEVPQNSLLRDPFVHSIVRTTAEMLGTMGIFYGFKGEVRREQIYRPIDTVEMEEQSPYLENK